MGESQRWPRKPYHTLYADATPEDREWSLAKIQEYTKDGFDGELIARHLNAAWHEERDRRAYVAFVGRGGDGPRRLKEFDRTATAIEHAVASTTATWDTAPSGAIFRLGPLSDQDVSSLRQAKEILRRSAATELPRPRRGGQPAPHLKKHMAALVSIGIDRSDARRLLRALGVQVRTGGAE